MPRRLMLLGVAGGLLGIVAEVTAFHWTEAHLWAPDLLTGWTFIGAGVIGGSKRPQSRIGPLMVGTGFTWFLGNFASVDVPVIAWLAAAGLYLYRGPLIHTVLSFPSGRLGSRLDTWTVAVGYVVAAAEPLARNGTITIVYAGALVAVAAHGYRRAIGPERRARAQVVRAAVVVGFAFAGSAAVRMVFTTEATTEVSLIVFDLLLAGVAVDLLASLLGMYGAHASVTDLVVELTGTPAPTLRDELARALGDPTIQVGYLVPGSEAYVDAAGQPIEFPGLGRVMTPIELDGRRIGVLIHDPAVSRDPRLMASIASAASLASSNARLQAEVRAQVAEVRASRRRLLVAADEERQRLERRLRDGAGARLVALGTRLAQMRASAKGARERLDQAEEQLQRTLEDLHELAHGLFPAALREEGLGEVLEELIRESSIPIEVDATEVNPPEDVKAAAYFVCAEALANIAKYAAASAATVTIASRGGMLVVEVADDGVGGADPRKGSGLRGLADRVEAIGGRLAVESTIGTGTRLTAEIPLGGEAS